MRFQGLPGMSSPSLMRCKIGFPTFRTIGGVRVGCRWYGAIRRARNINKARTRGHKQCCYSNGEQPNRDFYISAHSPGLSRPNHSLQEQLIFDCLKLVAGLLIFNMEVLQTLSVALGLATLSG